MREAPLKMHANVLTLNPRGPRVAVFHITFYQLTCTVSRLYGDHRSRMLYGKRKSLQYKLHL